MDFEIPFDLYTREAYNSILIQLRQDIPNQTEGLSKLSRLLTYGDQDKLNDFPIDDFSREVLRILDSTMDQDISMLASKCVFGLLEAHTRSTSALVNNNALQILANQLIECKWIETAEFCMQALNIISRYRAAEISLNIGLDPFLKMIDHFKLPIQRCALLTTVNVTSIDITQKMTNHIPKLLELSKNPDPQLQKSAIKTINNIASRVSPENIKTEISTLLCQSAPLFLDALINLSTNELHISKIIEADIDFEKIFKETNNAEKQMSILKLILNLLPSARCLNQFPIPKHPRPDKKSTEFAVKIQPILLKLLLENPLSLKYLLMCITFTLNVHKIELTEEIAFVLRGFGKLPENSPYVLAILTFFESSPLLAQSHILDSLVCGDMLKQQKGWFTRTLNKLRKKVSQNLKEVHYFDDITIEGIIGLISNNTISKFEFLTHGVKRLKELIGNDESAPTINVSDAKIITDFLLSLLNIVDIPTISDMSVIDTFKEELGQIQFLPIRFPGGIDKDNVHLMKISRFDTVGMVEAIYNLKFSEDGYDINTLLEIPTLQQQELYPLIFNKRNNKFTYNQISVICRVLDQSYQRFHLEETSYPSSQYFGDYNYGIIGSDDYTNDNDNSELKKFNSNISFFEIHPRSSCNLSLVSGDCEDQLSLKPKKTFDSLTDICELLERLSKVIKVGQNTIFSRKIRNLLINPKESLYHSSVALDTIYLYPFLFPFDLRLFAFKIMAFEPISAIQAWGKEFSINLDKLKEILKDDPLKVTVRRDTIANDGFNLFSNFSSNQMKFEISYENEVGIGVGPTNEFFTLFSDSLCLVERGFFRSEVQRRGPVVNKLGMFFSPKMDDKKASLLGKFIAKAIQMECLIDIYFNPALFKLLRGKTVTVAEVEPEYANSFQNPDGLIGLTFEYPISENDSIPLIEGGQDVEVTKENVQQYIELFTDYICGKKMKELSKSFIEGFNSVFPFSYLDVFTEDELNKVIAGDAPQITREELEKNVEISHGYSADSKQIRMLFEIISEMSKEEQRLLVQFITGYTQLPIGGLASLNPKLSVAKKDPDDQSNPDEPLPSCMTCKNYFKLPPYSTKEIMLKKILTAIYEGRVFFNMT